MKNGKYNQILTIALFICLGFHFNDQEIYKNKIDNDGFQDCIDNDCNNLRCFTMAHTNTLFRPNYIKRPPDIYGVKMFTEHIKRSKI